ncbi:MAG: bacillithiol system redox-active protein YtxJ [Acidobacteria bacterium]|nr:bacillithiol system redox-active protein YtxJ [Acidobacteriota bacterium]MBK9529967.1 bacillithiol system redox-active protein YtxJ [Acidobacteriota bacterium]MBP7475967.1 bacillithiol system redox-active protein YtxJ [Pyrinomonadaceae bacterium]
MSATFKYINTAEDLDAVFAESYEHPVALLKHSNSCGISSHVMYLIEEIDAVVNVIVIQEHRDLSNDVEMRTGHRHQSPQLFVLRDGKPIYHATHYGIDPQKVAELLK